MAARGAATERLRRSLQQQAEREREAEEEEEEEEEEKKQVEDGTVEDKVADGDRPRAVTIDAVDKHRIRLDARPVVGCDDELLYGCDEAEAQRHHAVAAEARAAALEEQLAATQQRLEEAQRQAERAQRVRDGAGNQGTDMASATRVQQPLEADKQQLCVICLERDRTHLLLPCGHKCLCSRCAARYDAHMRFEDIRVSERREDTSGRASGGGATEGVASAPCLAKGKPDARGACAHKSKNARRTQTQGDERDPPQASSTHHHCPLCRGRVIGVYQVWE